MTTTSAPPSSTCSSCGKEVHPTAFNFHLPLAQHAVENKPQGFVCTDCVSRFKVTCGVCKQPFVGAVENGNQLSLLCGPACKTKHARSTVVIKMVAWVITAVVAIGLLIGGVFLVLVLGNKAANAAGYTKETRVAKQHVESLLKSPASAVWHDRHVVARSADGKCVLVWVSVSSHNGFGALMKNSFIVELFDVGENEFQVAHHETISDPPRLDEVRNMAERAIGSDWEFIGFD
jgi:hypothetical protein